MHCADPVEYQSPATPPNRRQAAAVPELDARAPRAPASATPRPAAAREELQWSVYAQTELEFGLKRQLGDLDRVVAWLMVSGMVNVAPGFTQTTSVINGAPTFSSSFTGPKRVTMHGRLSAWPSFLLTFRLLSLLKWVSADKPQIAAHAQRQAGSSREPTQRSCPPGMTLSRRRTPPPAA
jgi:hypothetical protein